MYIKKVWVGVEKGEQATARDNTGNIHYPGLHFVTLHYTTQDFKDHYSTIYYSKELSIIHFWTFWYSRWSWWSQKVIRGSWNISIPKLESRSFEFGLIVSVCFFAFNSLFLLSQIHLLPPPSQILIHLFLLLLHLFVTSGAHFVFGN